MLVVKLVNGEHRIGIYALQDLEAGREVLMNYGTEFFVDRYERPPVEGDID